MYRVIVIEKGKRPYCFETDDRDEAHHYQDHILEYFQKCKFNPWIVTKRDELGDTYIKVFQDKYLIKRKIKLSILPVGWHSNKFQKETA